MKKTTVSHRGSNTDKILSAAKRKKRQVMITVFVDPSEYSSGKMTQPKTAIEKPESIPLPNTSLAAIEVVKMAILGECDWPGTDVIIQSNGIKKVLRLLR